MTHIKSHSFSQAAVEQATGLSREVLRKWELRYQFPMPVRGARGQRLYREEDIVRLQLIQRLAAQGLRAGKLVPLSLSDLQAQQDAVALPTQQAVDPTQLQATAQALLACLKPGAAPSAVSIHLEQLVKKLGLALLVDQYLPVFHQTIGDAWAAGLLSIHAEHHYTESVRNMVLRALSPLQASHAQPRVLLTTPPGELHGLGLLGLQAALNLHGADCVSLGTQMPLANVVQAVRDLGAKVVALSVSVSFVPALMLAYVTALRQQLPPDCHVWIGGQGAAPLLDTPIPGVAVFQSTAPAVQAWLQLANPMANALE